MKKNSIIFAVIYTLINIVTFVLAVIILKQQIKQVSFFFATLCNIIISLMVTISYKLFNSIKGKDLLRIVGGILPIGIGLLISRILFKRYIFIYSVIVYVFIVGLFILYGLYLLFAVKMQHKDNQKWEKLIHDVKK